jgi:GNAT superfamily N-acetyltransferase
VNVTFHIAPISDDAAIMQTVAKWSIEQWGADFPNDSIETYLNLYKESANSTSGIPRTFVALDKRGAPVGTITFIADDDLPQATEPGPWLAALFVAPEARSQGLGHALVNTVCDYSRALGYHTLYLYTADLMSWYEDMGWTRVRKTELTDHEVTVMSRSL